MPQLVIYYRKNGTNRSLLGITVSTKLGKAVVRNKLRRRLRELYRIHEDQLNPGYTMVLVARGRAVKCPFSILERSFLKAADKAGLLRKDAVE